MKGKVYSRLLCFIEGSVTQLIQQLGPHQVWRHVLAVEVEKSLFLLYQMEGLATYRMFALQIREQEQKVLVLLFPNNFTTTSPMRNPITKLPVHSALPTTHIHKRNFSTRTTIRCLQ